MRGRPVPSSHCRPPRPSSPPAPCPRSGPDHRRCRPPLSPARAEPHPPRLVPPGLDLCPPHPRQEFHKPPLRPPLPLLPMATATPTTSKAPKPRGNRRRRTTGRGPPSPRCCRPCRPGRGQGGEGAEHSALSLPGSCSRSVRQSFPCHRHRCWGIGGGERPRRRLPGAEAAAEETAVAEMTCFVVGLDVVVLCFWFGGDENYWM